MNVNQIRHELASQVAAIDVGHSGVKAAFGLASGQTERLFFPSAVAPAFTISDEVTAAKARKDTVSVKGRSYFVGETAILQAADAAVVGLSDDWVTQNEHTALLKATIDKIKGYGGFSAPRLVVLGLPDNVFKRHRETLRATMNELLEGKCLVQVVPQAFAAYQYHMINEHGDLQRDVEAESWGVVDVGFFTTDIAVFQKNEWTEKGKGIAGGVSDAAQHLQRAIADRHNVNVELGEAEAALLSKKIVNFGKTVDVTNEANEAVEALAVDILDKATQKIEPFVRRLNGVIVAGGGAPLIHKRIEAQWPHAVLISDHRYAVAEGMRRFGLGCLLDEALESAA